MLLGLYMWFSSSQWVSGLACMDDSLIAPWFVLKGPVGDLNSTFTWFILKHLLFLLNGAVSSTKLANNSDIQEWLFWQRGILPACSGWMSFKELVVSITFCRLDMISSRSCIILICSFWESIIEGYLESNLFPSFSLMEFFWRVLCGTISHCALVSILGVRKKWAQILWNTPIGTIPKNCKWCWILKVFGVVPVVEVIAQVS